MNNRDKRKYLYDRAGFGIDLKGWRANTSINALVKHLLDMPAPEVIASVSDEEWQANSPKALKAMKEMQMDASDVKMKQKDFRQKTAELNMLWGDEMVKTEHPLREKMALFWHGHFATRSDNPYFDQLLLHDLRTHALGHFSDLLTAVSHSPAMLRFLNNQQNRKQHPNENFAREVMELFTLGRGHYTEDDIKEAARAFTGWAYDDDGVFIFREKAHDAGTKNFLGKTGNFNGDDVLKIILEQRQTAVFLTQKIYRFFVNEEELNEARIASLAKDFYDSNYDIGALLHQIFTASWFYDAANVGAHIKSPIELLVGLQRLIPIEFKNERTLINLQKVLGQQLFYPPNVAGWPGGRAWIDSSSLVIRLSLPEAFFGEKELNLHAKEQDAEMDMMSRKIVTGAVQKEERFRVSKVAADWSGFLAGWQDTDRDKLPDELASFFFGTNLSADRKANVLRFADPSSTEHYIKSLTILFMSLPEYQLT